MFPPIAALIAGSASVKALIGTNPIRFWPFGQAQKNASGVVETPYVVWQTIYGPPENYLNRTPDIDNWGVQIDVYADTATSVRSVAKALRDVLEPHAHITGWRGESIDPDTNKYRYSFDVEFWTPR